MDAFAHGLKIAARIRKDGVLKDFVKQRYASWDERHRQEDRERARRSSRTSKPTCSRRATPRRNVSGRQEMLENIINRYLA